jgi:pantothenate kinase
VRFSDLDAVVAHLSEPATPSRRLVGIAGEPGAGKSTIAEQLAARLGAALLPMDGYHLPQQTLRELGRRDRMGAPDTFDVDGFVQTLADLRLNRSIVLAPAFDREIEEAVADAIEIRPEVETVIVEGNYLLLDTGGWERVAGLLDEIFFVEIDRDIRLLRLIDRHRRYGKSEAEARAWALGPDEANAEIIRATASRADHRIRGQ